MSTDSERLHALDALRAGALLLGIVLHGTMSYMPMLARFGWPIVDDSPSEFLQFLFLLIHIFRMTVFFVIAGFFAHLLLERRGLRGFIKDRSKRVLIPFTVGWIILIPSVIAIVVWAASNSTTPLKPPPQPSGAFAVPLMHLWFLYLLALFYIVVLAARALALAVFDATAIRSRIDAIMAWSMRSHLAPLLLALPVAACLAVRARWSVYEGIPTPDQSLIPNLPAFVGYGAAFVFGWLLHRQRELLAGLQRAWIGYVVAALAITAALMFLGQNFRLPIALDAVAYATASWIWTFALIGVALRFLSAQRPSVRYLADSSYWIYLLHLPVVFGLQELMSDWRLHWGFKFPLLLIVATLLLLASYHFLVRSTAVGQVLSGKRYGGARSQSSAIAVRS